MGSKNKSSISCCVLGAGTIGMIFAAYLKRIGIKVYILHHKDKPKTVLRARLQGSDLSGDYSFEIVTPEKAIDTDFILVATKAPDVLNALKGVQDVLNNGSDVIILSNGMGFHEKAKKLYQSARIFAATTTEAAHTSESGLINHSASGSTVLGAVSFTKSPKWLTTWLNAIPGSSWTQNIKIALWEKLAINCVINPLTATHNCRNGDLMKDPALKELVKELCLEIEMVRDAAKIPCAGGPLFDLVSKVIFDTATNFSSMLQDMKAGRTTEIESITGYLVEMATILELEVPANKKLLEEIRIRYF